jgi:hypothetical protein
VHQYIIDTRFAASGLIELINRDREVMTELFARQEHAAREAEYHNLAFLQREMHPFANYWHGLSYEAAARLGAVEREIRNLEGQILDKRHSLGALAGALLQISKQGISSVRGRPQNCPRARAVRGVDLSRIIWAGRNQAQHFEQPGRIDDETAATFAELQIGDARAGANLALEVVSLLNWVDYDLYSGDMVSLLG